MAATAGMHHQLTLNRANHTLSWTGNFDWSRTDPCSETKHGTSPGPSSFIPVHHLGICHLPGINPSSGPDQDDRDDHDLMSTLKRIGRNNEETAPDYALLPGIEASFDLDSFVPMIRPGCSFRGADRQSLPLVQALPAIRSWAVTLTPSCSFG
ncbi:hypothetical protein NEUTE1DRAFT_106782 [Neurospora tetrasperma FGSC 2508]|uniref:Uncharacterized protein n=1 Tax=Neurospora tetrasperma (strain FGSC 2508 / ATCC MYA-4615 / P0657) TaxID=510951 RepID=F8MAK3_NEUT8|nr:uncharacterized protein NEUTE1DRAFT_106782 [Neurospora tetrasperma FGSC 2508]EGO60124.1 hypothetical protein NEUTE1DRAFT_106782 [Neurospora tetrasperma FGSC 2508]EGZ75925.1 hypothetical protein NEUTE2DRAFT_136985 [Neurospora tetrasperma FGSC 2509]